MPSNRDYMRSFRRATQRVAFAVTAVASIALFATCNLDKITSTPPEGGVQIPNFHITGDGDTVINLGGLRYLGVDAGSADLTHTTQVWTSSNPAVATVGASDGLVQGVALGVATITVRLL